MRVIWGRVFAELVAGCLLASCTPPLRQLLIRAGSAGQAKVVVLRSDANVLYSEPLRVFLEQTDFAVWVLELSEHGSPRAIVSRVQEYQPDMILAMGNRAARILAENEVGAPVLYSMVPNLRKLEEQVHRALMGVSLETSAISDFMQFKLAFPDLSKVLVFCSEDSCARVNKAKDDLVPWGIDLTVVRVSQQKDIVSAFNQHKSEVDGVWLQNDSVVMNASAFRFLLAETNSHGIALLTSLSDNFAKAGALASVGVDLSAIGSQLASMTSLIVTKGVKPEKIGIRDPVGSQIGVNINTAKSIGIELSADSLLMVKIFE